MSKSRFASVYIFAVLSLACAASTFGQVATGTPPLGSFGGGPDVINLANLNAHITVPVLNKAGREMAFNYNLTYDTSVWYPVTSGLTTTWEPVPNWGWNAETASVTGYISNSESTIEQCGFWKYLGGGQRIWIWDGYVYQYADWVYHDNFGVSHPFSGSTTTSTGACPNSGTSTSINPTTTDGSGYTLNATGWSGTIAARNGKAIVAPLNSQAGASTQTDPNGNQISVSSTGVFTDTLGTTALTVAGNGNSSSPITFTYTAPSGANVSYTMKYSTYTVHTNFGCSGIGEFSATNVPLVSEIDLPDGTKYLFDYEATPGYSGDVTGRLSSVTLPTDGTISYSYSGGTNGIICADGTAATLTRTTPDGTWTYAHTESGTAWATTVTDPQHNQTAMNFQGIYETERQVQGSALLETIIQCYNGNTSNCNSTAITLPITQRTVFVQWPGGLQSRQDYFYDITYGTLNEKDEYAYGNGAPGSLVRKTKISYMNLGNNFASQPGTVTVEDGGNNIKSQTVYTYDQGTPTATSGTPQHISVSGSRGNATTISYLVQGSTTLSKTYTYYDTGTVNTATDVNLAQTTYAYGSGSCGNSFVTSVSEPLSLSSSMVWNCTGGVETSITDENGKTASATYDDPYFWRPNAVTDPISYSTSLTYIGQTSAESSLPFNGSSSTVDVLATVDGLGRSHISQLREGPGSTTFDSVETDYDSLGRPNRTTLPYAGTAGQTNSPPAPATNTTYDPLGRMTQVTDGGGGSLSITYSQNDTYQTASPAPSGENTKRKQLEYDALGRLTSVCEITSGTGSGACVQTSAATGFWTEYTYDLLNDLTGVTQNAQSSNKQTRTYAYDGMGRMTSEANPESGTTTYVYDSDSTCGITSSGDLVKKIDAVGNTICFTYDALHRNTSIIVTSGPYSSSTPKKYFVYDSATVNIVAMVNAKSRLAEAYTCTSSCATKITDLGFSYTARGEISDVYESTANSGGYYHVNQTYWANGALDQLSGLSVMPTITYNVDGEGRIYSASASSGQNPLASTSYNVASEPLQVNLGSSDSDSFTYYPNTDRMKTYSFSVNAQSVVGTLTWNAIGTLESLSITDPFNSSDAQNCSYSHDDLVRIASANCGSVWSQTFSYGADGTGAFGNLSKTGTNSFQPTYSYLTNRMTQIGSSYPTYDANGNVTYDSINTYAWDAAGKPVTIDGVGVTYDALGRMVERNVSGAYSQVVYTPTGAKLAIMNGQTLQKAFVPLTGGSMAVYNSSGLAYYRHSDWIGSSRFASTPTRTMYSDGAYGPFGEPYAQSGTADPSFTGMNQDTVSGLYDFPAREYGIQGRWPSPDPAGLAAAGTSDPQTLNRYAYVRNSPLHLVDPSGMMECLPMPSCGSSGTGMLGAYGGPSAPIGWALTGNLMAPASDLTPAQVAALNFSEISGGWAVASICCYGGVTQFWAYVGWGETMPGSYIIGPSSGQGGGSNGGGAPQTTVPANPCNYQGRALSPSDYATSGNASNGHPINFALDVFMGWPQGHYLDAQPLASGTAQQSAAYGNYVFGVYMAAAGVPLSTALSGADAYAFLRSSYPVGTPMDPNHGSLPAANVANITNGYNAQVNGTVCHN